MFSTILIYLVLALYFGLILVFWATNFMGLPGNWLMLLAAVVWIWSAPEQFQFSWMVLIGLVVLALIGELVEFLASVLGTKKMGGSSRGATLSVVGSIIGGLLGVIIGIPIPIPVIGMLISGILCASLGAMAGAVIGEYSLGTPHDQTVKIGGAAFVGRMLGTFGKIIMGAAMVSLIYISPFVF
jgi:uncharacterized protein YqgC (DUF456 family)